MTTVLLETDHPPAAAPDASADSTAAAPPTGRGRVAAIDIARGVALLGMFAVHVPYIAERPSGAWDSILEAPSGRASVLFFMLSGVSLSLIARRGSKSAETPTLVARGALLLLFGLVMSQFWFGSSILVQYGFVFLIAPWLLRRGVRALSAIIVGSLLLGPVLIALLDINSSLWIAAHAGITTGWLGQTLASALFSVHALVVWLGFFCIGMVIGRADLDSRRTALGLFVLGVAVTVAATVLIRATDHLVPSFDDGSFVESESFLDASSGSSLPSGSLTESSSVAVEKFPEGVEAAAPMDGAFFDDGSIEFTWTDPEWSHLWSGEPHANTTPWALQSAGIAMSVIGLLALLPLAATRPLAPLAALGSISLSAYVFHPILVQDVWMWTDSISSSFTWEVARVLIGWSVLLLLAWLIKRRWSQGPLEWALHRLSAGVAR